MPSSGSTWFDTDWFRDLENTNKVEPAQTATLPRPRRRDWADPKGYLPDKGLADALRVALILRKPLLLTGEPGTGKTDCASYLAWKLGHRGLDAEGNAVPRRPLLFEAKSNSGYRDLFYTYDALGRFQAKDAGGSLDPLDYIEYAALGEAILQSHAAAAPAIQGCLPGRWKHYGPAQSVVLIDEIDKAPRDFPNDLLNEIDKMYFKIPELRNHKVETGAGGEPVLVITSNSEKNLPAAFLRRCVFYHIPFPEKKGLERIVHSRIPDFAKDGSRLLGEGIAFFEYLRDENTALQKVPATAELLDWLLYLHERGADRGRGLREQEAVVEPSLVTLLKSKQDQEPERRKEIWDGWKPKA